MSAPIEDSLIDLVENARSNNNTLWMNILRIAMKHAPEETKATLLAINHNDEFITTALKAVAEGPQ